LGVSEIVYVLSTVYLACVELPTWLQVTMFLWRIGPLVAKFAQVHFMNGLQIPWMIMAQIVIHFYMWRSWCYVSDLRDTHGTCDILSKDDNQVGVAEEQILLNSWLVYWQQRCAGLMGLFSVITGGFGAILLHLVKDRLEYDRVQDRLEYGGELRHPLFTWFVILFEVCTFGWFQGIIFGVIPLWIAVIRLVYGVRFPHVVAGMLGRAQETDDL
jgi:hypothetical protein